MNILKRIKQIIVAKTITVTDRLLNEQDKLNLAKDELKEKYNKLAYVLGRTLAGKENIDDAIVDCEEKKKLYAEQVRALRTDPEKKEDAIYSFTMYKEYEKLLSQLQAQQNDFTARIDALKRKAKELNVLEAKLSSRIEILQVRLVAAKNNGSFNADGFDDDASSLIKEVEESVRNMECMNQASEIVNQARIEGVGTPVIDKNEMMSL